MAVQGLYALQNGFIGAQRSLLFYGEYSETHYPAPFFAPFYYRKNFDLPGSRWRLLDGDTELVPGVTVLRTDGHTPGHQSLLVELPESGPVVLAGDSCYWQEHIDQERVPRVVWDPTRALHSVKKLKTHGRPTGGGKFSPPPPPPLPPG